VGLGATPKSKEGMGPAKAGSGVGVASAVGAAVAGMVGVAEGGVVDVRVPGGAATVDVSPGG
jgi:hypothetical protein